MSSARSPTPYLNTILYIAIYQIVSAAFVFICAFALRGARIFFDITLVAELGLALVYIQWLHTIRHRIAQDMDLAMYRLAFVLLISFGSVIVALLELHTCYGADYSSLKAVSSCTNSLSQGPSSSFPFQSSSPCDGTVVDESLFGECAAAQVSDSYIETARNLGAFTAGVICAQCFWAFVTIAIYNVYARRDANNAAEIESRLKFALLCEVAAKTGQVEHFVDAGTKFGKFTQTDVDSILETLKAKPSSNSAYGRPPLTSRT